MTLEILVKPAKFQEAIRRLGKKKPVARKLSSKQWAAMPTQIRERAYFTANVESMKFLNRSKKMMEDYLSGARETVTTPDGRRVSALKKTSRADFVYEMQKLAKETGLGNVLPPGEDMSRDMITRTKDIASESRLNLIFDTQTQQAQSYGYYKQGQDPAILDAYPAQRFIRAEQRKVPRPLHKRNRNEVRRKDDMEFWLRMNDQSIGGLGVPFGPWGFNSGMDVEDVRRDKAIQMGLIEKNEQVLPPDDTFNKGLKAAADVEPEFLEKFMNKMGDEAINYGKTVELSQRMSDVPPPAPAKPVKMPDRWVNKPSPHDLFPSATLEKDVRRFQSQQLDTYARREGGEKFDITEESVKGDINIQTKSWTKKAHSFVRVRKGTLTKILEDGRFKTQYETQSSGGVMDNSLRARVEENLFSYPKTLPETERPVYGYATQSKYGFAEKGDIEGAVGAYGRIWVKLKSNTRGRTTVTFGDSLTPNPTYLPSPLDNPTYISHPLYNENAIEKALSNYPGEGYVELQVHGGGNVEDIEKVYFPEDFEPSSYLIAQLKRKGIKWIID